MTKIVRGITAETRTTSRKGFAPSVDKHDGLNIAKLINVEMVLAENPTKSDAKTVEFRNLHLPRLVFHYEGVVAEGEEAPYIADSMTPYVPGSASEKTYLAGDTSKIKHIIETFKDGTPITKEEFATLTIDIDDLDPESPSYGQDVLNAYRSFYEAVVAIFNGQDDKPIYEGKEIFLKILWIVRQNGKGFYGIPNFINKGIIELIRKDKDGKMKAPRKIKIEIGKGESVIEKVVEAVNMTSPGMPSGPGGATDIDVTLLS